MDPYYRPASISDACELLRDQAGATVIAGGQTLMLHIREGLMSPSTLVDVSDINDLQEINDEGETVVIGAANTYATIGNDPTIQDAFPFFADAIGEIAGPQVRQNGTIGGGLCYGDPALDTPPVLLTLDASVTLQTLDSKRELDLPDFYTGYYETALEPDELLTHVTIPKLPDSSAGRYRTMTPRQGDYAIAGVAVRLTMDSDGECDTARIGLTNAGDVPMRAYESEQTLEGSAIDDETVDEAVANLRASLDLLEDIQTPKSYRETIFQRLTKQTIRDVRDAVEGSPQ